MFFVLSVSVPSCPFVTSILITAWFATTRAHIVATWRKSKFEHCHVSFAFIIFHILALPPASHETFVHHFNTFLSVIPIMYSIMERQNERGSRRLGGEGNETVYLPSGTTSIRKMCPAMCVCDNGYRRVYGLVYIRERMTMNMRRA